MPAPDSKQPLKPSLLDRLTDLSPEEPAERWTGGYQLLSDLRDSIRRDLERLLNTRQRWLDWPSDAPEEREVIDTSVLAYGVRDVSGRNLASHAQRAAFLRSIESLIRAFEPRLQQVRVQLRSAADPYDRTLHFAIDGEVLAEPANEPLSFDTLVEPVTRTLRVEFSDRRQ